MITQVPTLEKFIKDDDIKELTESTQILTTSQQEFPKPKPNLEIVEEKKIIKENDNTINDEITLHNLTLEGNIVQETNAGKGNKKPDKKGAPDLGQTPPSNLPYSLVCTIDTSEAPRQFSDPEFLKNIGWNIRIFSTDTLGFCHLATFSSK